MAIEDNKAIIQFYISYINKGKIEITDVPEFFRDEVQRQLIELEGSEE